MRVWAIVPVKPFVRAKSRLARVLPAIQRKTLAESMFRHSISALLNTHDVAGITVLSRDTGVLSIAHEYGLHTIQECGAPTLNSSLQRASEVLQIRGERAILVVPADLPFLTSEDLEQIIHLGRYLMTVVIVPDRSENDTNALLMRPADLMPFSFGPGSFRRHVTLAKRAGAGVQLYRSNRVALDIDTPSDLDLYHYLLAKRGKQWLAN